MSHHSRVPRGLLDYVELSVRLPSSLLKALARNALKSRLTSGHYASTTLDLATLDPVTHEEAAAFSEVYRSQATERVHTTLRISLSLRRDVKAAAQRAGWSVNKYVCWALWRHLSRK